jgi:hypothetical protein
MTSAMTPSPAGRPSWISASVASVFLDGRVN